MSGVFKYFRISAHLIRTSVQAQAQYRWDFFIQLLMSFFWVVWNVLPIWLVFDIRSEIAGWNRSQAMLVMSFFLILRALIEGTISPNLSELVSQIRSGKFDFVLLKPIDSQLMISLSHVVPYRIVDLISGCAIAVWSVSHLNMHETLGTWFLCGSMLIAGILTSYAVWLLLSCSAFWFVKVDNLIVLFNSLFDAARWPITMFRGWVRAILTFVLPIAIMTSYPAFALLHRLTLANAIRAWSTCILLLIFSRIIFRTAIQRYSSASS